MRFNPFEWTEINAETEVSAPKGRLWLRCSKECAVYVTAEGYEVLAGTSLETDLTLSQEVTFRVEAPKGARIFLYRPIVRVIEPEGEVFTNPDRMPGESGSLDETKRALRMFQLEQRGMIQAMREAKEALERQQRATHREAEVPPVTGAPEPETATPETPSTE